MFLRNQNWKCTLQYITATSSVIWWFYTRSYSCSTLWFTDCYIYLSIWFCNSCRCLPETKCHSSLFLHWSGSKFLVMAACTPSIHIFLGCLLFLLSSGIHSIINFDILSSGILLTWPYQCSLFFCMISGFPFTPIISFIRSFFVLSILELLADLLSTSISVDKILFSSLVRICCTSPP